MAASAGHIRDLPVKNLGIDVDDNFKAKYVNIKDKSKVISNLKKPQVTPMLSFGP